MAALVSLVAIAEARLCVCVPPRIVRAMLVRRAVAATAFRDVWFDPSIGPTPPPG